MNSIKFIIDRFEGDFAVCEGDDMKMYNIQRDSLPKNAKEGDIIYKNKNGIFIDVDATMKRKKRIEELTKDLWTE